jgi:hypothetical protein
VPLDYFGYKPGTMVQVYHYQIRINTSAFHIGDFTISGFNYPKPIQLS